MAAELSGIIDAPAGEEAVVSSSRHPWLLHPRPLYERSCSGSAAGGQVVVVPEVARAGADVDVLDAGFATSAWPAAADRRKVLVSDRG
jgi:hypothetical protein